MAGVLSLFGSKYSGKQSPGLRLFFIRILVFWMFFVSPITSYAPDKSPWLLSYSVLYPAYWDWEMKGGVEAAGQMEDTRVKISWTNSSAFILENTWFFLHNIWSILFKDYVTRSGATTIVFGCIIYLRSSSIFKKNWGRLPFSKKLGRLPFSRILRSSSIFHLTGLK